MRLNAFLARAGVASRRRADELIKAGRVTVNGEAGQLNTVVGARDRVEVDGQEVERQRLRYVLLHKPAGVVTTARDPQGRPTVVELVPGEPRVVPVGRLDVDTTGALLLTNDGPLAHRLAHPRYGVEKTYVAEVEGDPDADALRRLRDGIELDDGPTAPARARRLRAGRVELVLHEGRKHQVKRMLAAVGHPVTQLHRSAYAGLTLDGLEPGSVPGAHRPRGRAAPNSRPASGLDEAHALVHRLERRLARPPRLLRADREQALQLPLVGAQRLEALADRRQQCDDRLADRFLEVAVARAVEALLERRRPARRWRRS